MNVYRRRDLTVMEINEADIIVTACDSVGSIGAKANDVFSLDPVTVGRFAVRVPLMETLSSGAIPIAVFDTVSNEFSPTASLIIQGIRDELITAGFGDIALNGSTEENFETSMTAVGVTVFAHAKKNQLRFQAAKAGDILLAVGRPLLGQEVLEEGAPLADYGQIMELLRDRAVREIVPVGSRGIKHEADTLAALSALTFSEVENSIDLGKSAGPGSCLIVAASNDIRRLDGMMQFGELA